MQSIRASEQLPPPGIHHCYYNGDHCLFQVHDGGFRVINYHGEKDDSPKLNLVKWIPESPTPVSEDVKEAAKQYCDKIVPLPDKPIHVNIKHVREDVYDAFLAGAAHQTPTTIPSDKPDMITIDACLEWLQEHYEKIQHPDYESVDEVMVQDCIDCLKQYKLIRTSGSIPSDIVQTLDRLIVKYEVDINIKKGFEKNGESRENKNAAAMWRHKREGLESALKDLSKLRKLLSQQPLQGNADVLVKALERISHPIMHLRTDLKEGEQLNGQYAMQLSNDPEYLKGIAREALASYNTGRHQEVKK